MKRKYVLLGPPAASLFVALGRERREEGGGYQRRLQWGPLTSRGWPIGLGLFRLDFLD